MNTDTDRLSLMDEKVHSLELAGQAKPAAYPHQELTHEIIGAAYEVHRELGGGFLEKVYERAIALELAKRGMSVKVQIPIPVHYKGQPVGDYFADLVVNDVVLCEIKAGDALHTSHQAQLLHYLKATQTKVGLLLNFGPERVSIKRMVS